MVMIILAYLWVLALVPLLSKQTDADVQWHARHGVVLTVVELAGVVAWSVIVPIVLLMTGGLFGCIFALELLLAPLLVLAVVAFHGVAIVKALKGERLMVPRISEYANRF